MNKCFLLVFFMVARMKQALHALEEYSSRSSTLIYAL